jgi:Icc protein
MAKTGTRHPDGPETAGGRVRPLRILQLTDLHLFADPNGRLLGQTTRLTFESVIALAQRLRWRPDALVLTGDLIHDESLEGYRFLRQRLEQLDVTCFCLPGNHDRVDLLAGYLDAGAVAGFRVESFGAWDLVLLDSTLPFDEGGHLEPALLADLERHVSDHPERPQLVLLHHHPAPVGSHWIDTMRVDNGAELLASAGRHRNIRGIACGHVHQAFLAREVDFTWLSAPSTCVQFLPGSDSFALDPLTPGYRWFELHADGRIDTGIERTAAYPEPLHPSTSGY